MISFNSLYESKETNDNITFKEPFCRKYVEKLGFPIIKIKKILMPVYDSDILPSDFNATTYKGIHKDLENLEDNQLIAHFLNNGIRECRLYKRNQEIKCPQYIRKRLRENNILPGKKLYALT